MAELVRVKSSVLCLLTSLAGGAGIMQRSEVRTRGTKLLLCTHMSVKLDKVPAFTCCVIKIFSGSVNIVGLDRADELGLGDGRFTGKH